MKNDRRYESLLGAPPPANPARDTNRRNCWKSQRSRRLVSPKRLELLRHVHQRGAKNIRVLASALGRDDRRVHEHVEALEAAGLVDRDEAGLRAEYEAFDVQMRVAL